MRVCGTLAASFHFYQQCALEKSIFQYATKIFDISEAAVLLTLRNVWSVTVFVTSPLFLPPGSAAQPFSPFWFTVEPQDTLVIRGNSALLNCSAHSDAATPARVEWKKDGTFMSLVSDERRRILPDGSLLFTHVVHSKHNKPDEGTYQCVATIENLGSISSRTARLSVAGECSHVY